MFRILFNHKHKKFRVSCHKRSASTSVNFTFVLFAAFQNANPSLTRATSQGITNLLTWRGYFLILGRLPRILAAIGLIVRNLAARHSDHAR